MALLPKLIADDGRVIEINKDEMIIGRDPACEIAIHSESVSRRHARLTNKNGQIYLEDIRSRNGVFVNGMRLNAPLLLKDKDQISLGRSEHLTFSFPQPPVTPIEISSNELKRVEDFRAEMTQTVEGDPFAEIRKTPPRLMVSVAGQESQTHQLLKSRLTIGRNPENDIVIPSPIVSGYHATIERTQDGYILTVMPNATNPIFHLGRPIGLPHLLSDGDVLRLGGQDPGMIVTLVFHWAILAAMKIQKRLIQFGDKNLVQLGRDPSNDVVLDSPLISRYHTAVERVGQRFRVRDLGSTNGTFVNDQRIDAETWLKAGDTIRIGPFRFEMRDEGITGYDETHGLRLEALGLNKWVRKDLNLLKNLYLLFQPREFVVVVGQSGGGKSTLVDAIAGYRPATHGKVLVNNVDIYQHFESIRNEIGFVPQRDIIHMELTAYQALDYSARLRMPADIAKEERHQRIMEVLTDLDLAHRQDVQISGLSGGQQKRVSIGVELLTKPGLFFLDEPTSGLDPGNETALMHLMRRLADQGRTIILITHATKNVMLADKVIFLARGGYLAWFGPPDEALEFFDGYRTERDRRGRSMEFDEIYAILDDSSKGKPEDWANRFAASTHYQDYIIQPLARLGHIVSDISSSRAMTPVVQNKTVLKSAVNPSQSRISGLRQFSILSSRNIKILTRDRVSLFLMLIIPPLIALLDVVLAVVLGRDLFSYLKGSMRNISTTLFQPAILAVMVGALSTMREFVKEADIYRRERLVNLKVLPYVSSKYWVAILLAFYQAAAYTIIHYLAFKMPGGVLEFLLFYFTLVLASLAGISLGFLASAIAPNANTAQLIVILFIIPQFVIGGTLIPVPSLVSAPTSTRWAYEVLMSVTGAGSDVASDACWDLPEDVRDHLSLEDKTARGCRCMGLAALNQESCYFPGIGAYYNPALNQPEPLKPLDIGSPPTEPVLPSAPVQPANPSDQAAMAQFFVDLKSYQDQVNQIQASYKVQMEKYQKRADVYKQAISDYQKALAQWEIDRNTAVSKAEAVMKQFKEDIGFGFVNKKDHAAYWSKIAFAWGMQLGIIVLIFFLILFAIYRKDRT